MSTPEGTPPNPEPDAKPAIDSSEGGLAWTPEAEKRYELGDINATQASMMSGIPHELPKEPSQDASPAESSPQSTLRSLHSGRPPTAQEVRQKDVGSAALEHKPTTYRNFTQERIAREKG